MIDGPNIYAPSKVSETKFTSVIRPKSYCEINNSKIIYPNRFKIIGHPDEATSAGLYYINTKLPKDKLEYLQKWIAHTLQEQTIPAGFKNASIKYEALDLSLGEQYEMSLEEMTQYYKQELNSIRFINGAVVLWGQQVKGTGEFVCTIMTKIRILRSCLELITNLDLIDPDPETRHYANMWVHNLSEHVPEIYEVFLSFETSHLNLHPELRYRLRGASEIRIIDLSNESALVHDLQYYENLMIIDFQIPKTGRVSSSTPNISAKPKSIKNGF